MKTREKRNRSNIADFDSKWCDRKLAHQLRQEFADGCLEGQLAEARLDADLPGTYDTRKAAILACFDRTSRRRAEPLVALGKPKQSMGIEQEVHQWV